jgi:hypothetical protein
MSKKSEYVGLKQFSAVVAVIAFIADLITIIFFAKDLLFGFDFLTFGSTITQVFIIALTFAFAFLLFNYAREINKDFEGIVRMFGWLYILLAALIFMIVSFHFTMFENYSFGEFIGYPLLVIFVLGLGVAVSINAGGDTKYFSIPFMVVALEQIALWVTKIISFGISFTLAFLGTLIIFVLVGLIILFLLSVGRLQEAKRHEDQLRESHLQKGEG